MAIGAIESRSAIGAPPAGARDFPASCAELLRTGSDREQGAPARPPARTRAPGGGRVADRAGGLGQPAGSLVVVRAVALERRCCSRRARGYFSSTTIVLMVAVTSSATSTTTM